MTYIEDHQRYLDEKRVSEMFVEHIAADIMAKSGFADREWLGSDERSEAIWDVLNRARRENALDECQLEYLRALIDDETSKEGLAE